MESSIPFDFGGQNNTTLRSSDATRDLARKHGGVIPPDDDKTLRYFQPRIATHDPPPGALMCVYGDMQSNVASNTDMTTSEEESKSSEAGTSKNRLPSASDEDSEEMRLIRASNSFDTQIEQYRPSSRMDQSAGSTQYRYGTHMPYPHRRQYDSHSSGHSAAMISYQGGAQSNDIRVASEDDSHHVSREIANRISTLTTFLGRSPGISSESTTHQTRLLTEIGQLVTTAICNLRFERDNARRDAKRLAHRAYRDNTTFRADNRRLQEDVKKAINREKAAKRDLDLANMRIDSIKYELDHTEKEALSFRDHHVRIKNEMKKSEETQRTHIQSLEGEIKRLRIRNAHLAKAAGQEPDDDSAFRPEFSPPSAPDSHKRDAEARHDFLYGMLKKKSDEQEDKQSKKDQKLDDKNGSQKYANSPSNSVAPAMKRKVSSTFNPEAPPFQPPLSSKNLAAVSDSGPAQSPTGGPSNWPALLGHNRKAPVMGRSDLQPATVIHAPLSGDEKHQGEGYNRHKSTWNIEDVDQAIKRITLLSKGYIVRCHKTGEATKVSSKVLSRKEESCWKYLINLVFTDNVFQAESHMTNLLGIEQYRSFLIMRVIQDYLYRKVISPSIFLGFDEKMDQHLAALQDRISQFGNPDYPCNVRDRQAVLSDHAKIIDEALRRPNMKSFKADTITRHVQILSGILHPLRGLEVADKDANAGIRTIVTLAWDMSTKVWTSGMMLSYFFPHIGAFFTEGNMIAKNLDAFDVSSQTELQFMQARVSFVISPALSLRDDRDGNNNGVYGLRKAEVIAMH